MNDRKENQFCYAILLYTCVYLKGIKLPEVLKMHILITLSILFYYMTVQLLNNGLSL